MIDRHHSAPTEVIATQSHTCLYSTTTIARLFLAIVVVFLTGSAVAQQRRGQSLEQAALVRVRAEPDAHRVRRMPPESGEEQERALHYGKELP